MGALGTAIRIADQAIPLVVGLARAIRAARQAAAAEIRDARIESQRRARAARDAAMKAAEEVEVP